MQTIYNKIIEIQSNREKAALCTIVATKGSTPAKTGAKMIVWEDKQIWETIGGGAIEKKVIDDAVEVIKKNIPQLFKHDLLRQHGMCCGGTLQIFIEPIMLKNKLYIFGAGHIGKAVAEHALPLDFEIFVIDERKKELEKLAVEKIDKIPVNHNEILARLPFDDSTFILIVTHDHNIDREILAYCIKTPFAYLGMIGSKRKVEMTKQLFMGSKVATKEELDKVDMPMGLDIKAQSPEEIAISILAKVIAVKNSLEFDT